MELSRLLDVEDVIEGFMFMPYIFIGIFALVFIIIVVTIIVNIIKRTKSHIDSDGMMPDHDNESTIATIFKKTFENANAKLDSESAKYKKITCPYCGAVNKGSDMKCSGCSAPLHDK